MNFFRGIGDAVNKWRKGDPERDPRRLLLCMLCTKSLCEPMGYLSCSHVMHIGCLWDYHKIQNQKKSAALHKQSAPPVGLQPVDVLCPVCKSRTMIPPGNNIHFLEKKPQENFITQVKSNLILDIHEGEEQAHALSPTTGFHNVEFKPDYEDYDYDVIASYTTDNNVLDLNSSGATIEENLDKDSSGHNIRSPQMLQFLRASVPLDETSPPPGHIVLSSDDNISKDSLKKHQKKLRDQKNTKEERAFAKGTGERTQEKSVEVCCREHSQICTLFCETCKYPICEKCSSKKHKDHLISPTDEILDTGRQYLKTKQSELRSMKTKQALYEGQLGYLLGKQEENLDWMINEVITNATAAQRAIEVQKLQCISELEKAFKAQREVYECGIAQVKYNRKCTQNLDNSLTEMLHGAKASMLMNSQVIQHRTATHLENTKSDAKWVSWLQTKAVFRPFRLKLRLGELHRETIELPNSALNHGATKVEPSPLLRGIQHDMPQISWTAMEKPHIGEVENTNPLGALFLEDNSLLVAYHGKQCISKYVGEDLDLSFHVHDPVNHFMPRDMARLDSETVVVADSRYMTLRLFDNDGSNFRCLQNELFRIERVGEQTLPTGVATLPGRNVAVSDSRHKTVYIIDPETEQVISTIGPLGRNKRPIFCNPEFLTFDTHHKRLLVSDSESNTVKLFDLNGSFLMEIGDPKYCKKAVVFQDGTRVRQYEGLQSPAATACDMNGNILVVNGGCHELCQFNENGEFLSIVKLYDKNKEVRLSWPQGIALGPRGEVAITEKTSARVTVAQLYK